jgi:cysteine-rich repeat protein
VCGDGTIQAGEECDDGNGTPEDGCTTCVVDCIGTKDPITFHCYQFMGMQASWSSAETSCVGFGGHLATITSQPEYDVVLGVAIQGGESAWIGASDAASEGDFVWTTGEPWVFEAWGPNEPDGGASQNCVLLWRDRNWIFNDFDCGIPSSYVCEWDPAGGG